MVYGAAGGVGAALPQAAGLAGVHCFGPSSPAKRDIVSGQPVRDSDVPLIIPDHSG